MPTPSYYLNKEDPGYNPFLERDVPHPTNDIETFIHLMKHALGAGFLAMPQAFQNVGLLFGLFASIAVGFISIYTKHMLVRSAHIICFRHKIPSVRYGNLIEAAFENGPPKVQKFAGPMKMTVNVFILLYLYGICCVYLVFVGINIKKFADHFEIWVVDKRVWIAVLTIPLVLQCLIRNLKYLVPFSLTADVLLLIGITMIMTYFFDDVPNISERQAIAPIRGWPLFLGTYIFCLEVAGAIFSIENTTKHPDHFIGCISILSIALSLIIVLYVIGGFFGYLKFGEDVKATITLNLPMEETFGVIIILLYACAIYFSFALNFCIAFGILWDGLKSHIGESKNLLLYEYIFRVVLVICCCCVAIALPQIGPFISLIGAVSMSTIGLIIPPIIELVVFYEEPGYGIFYNVIWRNIFLIIFGFMAFIFGTYVSILEFIEHYHD